MDLTLAAFIKMRSHGNPQTLARYLRYIRRFQGWLGSRKLTAEAVNEYSDILAAKYVGNSRVPMCAALNLLLMHRGAPWRFKSPGKSVDPNPRLYKPEEYEAILGTIADPAERLVVRLLHDSLLRPSDVAALRRDELDLTGRFAYIRKTTQKAGVNSESMLTPETRTELIAYLAASLEGDYLFPSPKRPGFPRHRTWPNKVLMAHGAEGISPRTFRRTGATLWPDDVKSLMVQGGWKSVQVIMDHYRRDREDRHVAAFEKAMGVKMDPENDPDNVPGYG